MVLFYSMVVYGWAVLYTSLTDGRGLHTVRECIVFYQFLHCSGAVLGDSMSCLGFVCKLGLFLVSYFLYFLCVFLMLSMCIFNESILVLYLIKQQTQLFILFDNFI